MSKLEVKEFKGCGNCELSGKDFDCVKNSILVNITFKNNEKADNWGKMVTVFRKGETVKGYAVVKDNVGYCVSAISNLYEGYEDFVSTDNVEVETIE